MSEEGADVSVRAEATSVQVTERGAARRLRFRESLSRLIAQATSQDLLRWIVIPGAVAIILGLNFIIWGWVGASRTTREIEQIPYLISGGLFGLAIVFLGGLLLASAFWMVVIRKFQEEAEERSRVHLHSLEERLTANGASARRPVRSPRRASKSASR